MLRIEAALGADRHDDGVLDLLRLHEAQHFGAIVLGAIRPAQTAARHLAEAQVHALDFDAVDEDFAERPRLRQAVDEFRIELEGKHRLRRAVGIALEIVGAQRRIDDIDVAAQDRSSSRLGTAFSACFDRCDAGRRAASSAAFRRACGSMRVDEELEDVGGDRRIFVRASSAM